MASMQWLLNDFAHILHLLFLLICHWIKRVTWLCLMAKKLEKASRQKTNRSSCDQHKSHPSSFYLVILMMINDSC